MTGDDQNPTAAEIDLMDRVDVHEWAPTEPDEMAVLDRFYLYDPANGTYSSRVGDDD